MTIKNDKHRFVVIIEKEIFEDIYLHMRVSPFRLTADAGKYLATEKK